MNELTLDQQLDKEAQAGENYIRNISEATAKVNAEAPPYTSLSLNPVETLLTFQAYRLLLRHYAQQESEPLDNIQQIVTLMNTLKPAAVEASKLFAPQGGQ